MTAATSTPTSISPPTAVGGAVSGTVGAVTALDRSVNALIALSAPDPARFPNLAAHVTTAQQHAQLWTTTCRPQVVGVLQGISTYASVFDGQYAAATSAATQIANGDAAGVDHFKATLAVLQTSVRQLSGQAAAAAPAITGFQGDVDGDIRALQSDLSTAQAQAQAADAQAAAARSRLQQLEVQREQEQAEIDAISGWNPILKLLSEALASIIDAITGEQTKLQLAQQAAGQANQAAGDAQAVLNATAGYAQADASVATGVTGLESGWTVLDANFNTLMSATDITSFNAFTPALLVAVKSDWDALAQQVGQIT